MKKILDKFYVLSKFSISLILLICLIFSLYLLYVNYNNEKIVTDNKRAFDKKIEENINKNSLVIQSISKELENNKFALSEINNNLSKMSKNNTQHELSNLLQSVSELKDDIAFLVTEIENLKNNNNESVNKNVNGSQAIIDNNKKDIIDLIKIRYENNLSIDTQIDYLKEISDSNLLPKIEKLSILSMNPFKGYDHLIFTFDDEADLYLKKVISNNEDSFLNKIILPYINISPTSKNQISDDRIILIKKIKKNIQNKKIENVYKNITSIENYRKNFRSTFSEIEKYINFKKELSYF